jgi:putative endonuclease
LSLGCDCYRADVITVARGQREVTLAARTKHELGQAYEAIASHFLASQGYRILARNWRCPGGELDLVAMDGITLSFIEVRARSVSASYRPEETVGPAKQRRLICAAEAYLAANAWDGLCRFDVVAIDIRAAGTTARLFKDAFGA